MPHRSFRDLKPLVKFMHYYTSQAVQPCLDSRLAVDRDTAFVLSFFLFWLLSLLLPGSDLSSFSNSSVCCRHLFTLLENVCVPRGSPLCHTSTTYLITASSNKGRIEIWEFRGPSSSSPQRTPSNRAICFIQPIRHTSAVFTPRPPDVWPEEKAFIYVSFGFK